MAMRGHRLLVRGRLSKLLLLLLLRLRSPWQQPAAAAPGSLLFGLVWFVVVVLVWRSALVCAQHARSTKRGSGSACAAIDDRVPSIQHTRSASSQLATQLFAAAVAHLNCEACLLVREKKQQGYVCYDLGARLMIRTLRT
jgi:hypothetical protein